MIWILGYLGLVGLTVCCLIFGMKWLERDRKAEKACGYCGGINMHDLDCDEIRRLKLTGGL